MTAIEKYARLESTARWIESDLKGSKDVIISLGKKTLIITNYEDEPLAHWSLTSTNIISENENESIFSPDPEGIEQLIIEDKNMIEAIELFISNKNKSKKKLNVFFILIPFFIIFVIGAFYSKHYKYYFLSLISDAQVTQILNEHIRKHIKNYGPVCESSSGKKAISELLKNLDIFYDEINIVVLSNQTVNSIHLPSGTLFISKNYLNKTKNSLDFISLIYQLDYEKKKKIPLKKIVEKNSLINIFGFVIGIKKTLNINSINDLEMKPRRNDIKQKNILKDHSWVAIQNICFN